MSDFKQNLDNFISQGYDFERLQDFVLSTFTQVHLDLQDSKAHKLDTSYKHLKSYIEVFKPLSLEWLWARILCLFLCVYQRHDKRA